MHTCICWKLCFLHLHLPKFFFLQLLVYPVTVFLLVSQRCRFLTYVYSAENSNCYVM